MNGGMVRYVPEKLKTDYEEDMTDTAKIEIGHSTVGNITSAIAGIMGDIQKLPKTAMNKHGSYNYASIDDFLDTVRPLCAKHGLVILQDEESNETADNWLHIVFRFTLLHSSGTERDGGKRSVSVNAKMGAQAYGAAQSYALKQYMRSLFQISTGEQSDEEGVLQPGQLPPKNSRDERWRGPLPKGKLQAAMKAYIVEIEAARNVNELEALAIKTAVDADDMPKNTPEEYAAGMSYGDVFEQCEHDQPGWITGDGMPDLFIPFNSHMDAALDRLGANGGDE